MARYRGVEVGYLARHGRATHPDELSRHECILRTTDDALERWPFHIGGLAS